MPTVVGDPVAVADVILVEASLQTVSTTIVVVIDVTEVVQAALVVVQADVQTSYVVIVVI